MPPTHMKESPRELPIRNARPQPERVVTTQELLAGSHRIWIQHAAER